MIEHDFDFDPTCGYSKEELLKINPPDTEPEDYEDFWRDTYAEAEKIPLNLTKRTLWSPEKDIEVYEISFNSWDGIRTGAWVVLPHGREIKGGIIFGHGYGGRAWFDLDWTKEGFACVFVCIRGFNLSSNETIPWNSKWHVVHNIDSVEKYVLRGSTVDIWKAADALLEMCPGANINLNYDGGSFGGGMGALALAWDRRFKAAHLGVPTFGHHPLRLKFKCSGSGESVREYHKENPEIEDVLKYYDAATAAKYVEAEVLASPALFDPAVVPPGQFAVANALKNSENFILPAGHFKLDGDDRRYEELRAKKLGLFSKSH